jgi:hypothetical protein
MNVKISQWAGCCASFFTILTSLLFYENAHVLRAFNEARQVEAAAICCGLVAVLFSVLCLVSASFDYVRNRRKPKPANQDL